MLLIDSMYINVGGGKILLDYLTKELESRNLDVFYLFYDRCSNDYQWIPENRRIYLKASLINRYRFYNSNRGKFTKIFCLGNIPPLTKQRIPVLTLFHQTLLILKTDSQLPFLKRLKLTLQKILLSLINKNSDKWIVQQKSIKDGLSSVYGINTNKIEVLPFYPPIPADGNVYERRKNSYIYVSSGANHKNHVFLITAFCQFYDKNRVGHLTLTVSDSFPHLLNIISEKSNLGYPILNLGFVNRENLYKEYHSHEYLVFPSLAESFGLGIVEAIENGCKVIGVDLPYMHEVCVPSLLFTSNDINSLCKAFELSLSDDNKPAVSKVSNALDEIIWMLR